MKKILLTLSFLCAIAGQSQSVVIDRLESDGSRQIMTSTKCINLGGFSFYIGLKMYEMENGRDWLLLLSSYNCIPEDNIILLKLNNDQIITLPVTNINSGPVDSYTPVYHIGNTSFVMTENSRTYYSSVYVISPAELDDIETYGIKKIRTGNNVMCYEKQYTHNALGKFITKSKKTILDRAKNSMVTKKTSIYDGF